LVYLAQQFKITDGEHYTFRLYLHGPYSFELDQDLLLMEAFDVLAKAPDAQGYGARYSVPPAKATEPVLVLARALAKKNVRQLESIATSEYVISETGQFDARRVREIKPHLTEEEVAEANAYLERMRAEVSSASVTGA
jgi:uncharacterized protein YwgA